ncbi:MAG: ADP-ribosylation factor-like protein [Candidatus Hodarchaeota archaeon]
MSDKGWVKQSVIDARLGYKLLIGGLAEAGKTAVKRIFFLRHTTEEVDGLSATLSYERLSITIKKTPITILDLGGQKIFLKRFLTTFSPFIFSSVITLVFLIDVSNRTTRNNAIQYFKACVEKLDNYSPEAKIFVFLHKNDLVEDWPNYETIHHLLKEEFQVECKKDIRFFRTTIFNPESVIKSFGRIIELSMPDLSNSELVNGRTIGEIEEFSKKIKPVLKPLSVEEISKSKGKKEMKFQEEEDPAYLERIRDLMRSSIVDESIKPLTSQSTLREVITEEMIEETELIHISSPEPSSPNQPLSHLLTTPEQVEINREISSLIDYYGIDTELATEIVNSGYTSLFKMAATAGVPINLVSDVIIKYIPFLKSKELNIEKLTLERLLDVFSSYLRGAVTQDDLFSCLIFATEKPKMSIDDIVIKYLTKIRDKPKKAKVATSAIPQQVPTANIEVVEGIIDLPNTKGLGFIANLIEKLVYLTLYCENRIVNRTKISLTISVKELIYLLSFQMNLESLGFITGGKRAISLAARIIHEALFQMKEAKLTSSSEIRGINVSKIMELEANLE